MEIHLASMENATCWAFRKLFPVTDSYTGMMSANYLVKRSKAWKEVDTFHIEGQKQWLQIATSRVEEVRELVGRLKRELEADKSKELYGIELNASCPSPFVCNLGQGAALVKRITRVKDLVNELLRSGFRVGVKVRLGLNYEEARRGVIFPLLEELEKIKDPNFSHVAVHFKHAKEPSDTGYDYEILKKISEFDVPLVINGGLRNYRDFNNIMKTLKPGNRKKIRGLMIGREVFENPNCFVEINNILNKTLLSERSLDEFKREFEENCKIHEPKEIYLKTLHQMARWI